MFLSRSCSAQYCLSLLNVSLRNIGRGNYAALLLSYKEPLNYVKLNVPIFSAADIDCVIEFLCTDQLCYIAFLTFFVYSCTIFILKMNINKVVNFAISNRNWRY